MASAACAKAGPLAITVAEVTVFVSINGTISSLSALSVPRSSALTMISIQFA
jgi:hypothetical protein